MYPSGSAPTRIYRTSKMHKISSSDTFLKLRLIFSSEETFNYDLARFLCDLLPPVVPYDYPCKDIFSFVSPIENANFLVNFFFPTM